MRIIQTEIPGAVILESRVFTDGRGFFLETYNERGFAFLGITERFVQDISLVPNAVCCEDCTSLNSRKEN